MPDDQWKAYTNDAGKKWEFKVDVIGLWKKLFNKKEKQNERIYAENGVTHSDGDRE